MFSLTFIKKYLLNASGIFILASMVSNFLNFVFNAYLGRNLSLEDFGLLTFINTLLLLSGIFINAYGSSVTHRVAFLTKQINPSAGLTFLNSIFKKTISLSLLLMFLWIILIPLSAKFFNIGDNKSLLLFTPVIALFLNGAIFKGYLSGNLLFIQVSVAILAEALSKLLFAVIFINTGFGSIVYLAIPLSLCVSLLTVYIFSKKASSKIVSTDEKFAFPRRFFVASLITGLSTSGFLTLDLLLVKHYLLPGFAGEYSLLSLTGKMIFFFGSLFNGLILAFTSQELGAKTQTKKMFNKLILGTVSLTILMYLCIVFLGPTFLPLVFGSKIKDIFPYLPVYCSAIALFTISSAFTIYHLAKHHFTFSFLAFISSMSMIIGIYFYHTDISQITHVIFLVSAFNLTLTLLMHALQKNEKFVIRNIIDLLNIFSASSRIKKFSNTRKRILIFNWRDIKHTNAGGAEIYIHELAKRWVKKGHFVTIFCGSDRMNPSDEIIDGVKIIRRGGFYFVYIWGFIYYLSNFRNKFNYIIDCHNGVPFFTPLYCKEKIFCLMFHVHQEVFSMSLPKPLAIFASVIENRLMPWAYRKVKFITISDSTKKEMEDLDVGQEGIEIVYPGIDTSSFKPARKNKLPLVVYIGRLKKYKSVDIFIKAAKKVLMMYPDTEFVIAGDGDEKNNLETLAKELRLGSKIKFLGRISEEEKIALYQKAWVFINPSRMEGWGITNIEANACGTPVVASNVPGISNSVNNKETGFLVEYGKHNKFAEKISSLIGDQTLRKKMSKQAILWSHNFDWQKSARKGLNFLS